MKDLTPFYVLNAITDKTGSVVERFSFDAFGRVRQTDWTYDPVGNLMSSVTTRGYTGHEQLNDVGLIHMNGRVYDPTLGRFASADPFIQAAANPQSLNRYSYVLNNPLSYTDPSGFFFKKLFKSVTRVFSKAVKKVTRSITKAVNTVSRFIKNHGREVFAAVAAYYAGTWVKGYFQGLADAAVGYCGTTTSTSAVIAGSATSGAVFGSSSTLLHGGSISDSLSSGLRGGITGAMFGWVKGTYGNSWSIGRVVATGTVNGVSAEVYGGEFKDGFRSGIFTSSMRYVYNETLGYDATWNRGAGLASPDGRYPENNGVPNGPNVWGTNTKPLTGNFFYDFFKQGGALSVTMNQVPGMNSLAKLHDFYQIMSDKLQGPGHSDSWLRSFLNVPAMIPATIINYGALGTDPIVQIYAYEKRKWGI